MVDCRSCWPLSLHAHASWPHISINHASSVPRMPPTQAEEMAQQDMLPPAAAGGAAVQVADGSFAWQPAAEPLLHDINLSGAVALLSPARAGALGGHAGLMGFKVRLLARHVVSPLCPSLPSAQALCPLKPQSSCPRDHTHPVQSPEVPWSSWWGQLAPERAPCWRPCCAKCRRWRAA